MKLGLHLGYWNAAPTDRYIELAQRAEALGFDIVLTAETYGSDVFTPLAVVASHTRRIRVGTAVMQIQARTPACAAMTAITLDHIANGRLCLGIGISGPQVIEGWYGEPFGKPVARTREWLEIFERIVLREAPLTFDGELYNLPRRGPGSTGLGKSLKSIVHPLRKNIPLFLAAQGPKNLELAAKRFNGWLPAWTPPALMAQMWEHELKGAPPGFEVIATLPVSIENDLAAALRPVKQNIAMVIGGYGSREVNFHRNMAARAGFGEAADRLQELWLSGQQKQAADAVPDELADAMSLVGPKEHVRLKLEEWRKSPVTTLVMSKSKDFDTTVANMEFLAKELL